MSEWSEAERNRLATRYAELASDGEPLFPALLDVVSDERTEDAVRWQLRHLRKVGRLKPYAEYSEEVETTTLPSAFPSGRPPLRRLYWDIETSPNIGVFWRATSKAWIPYENIIQERAIICICYKWEGSDTVHALTWDDGDDRGMIKAFLEVAEQADELVAHNGDKFDLKWFNTQCLKYGLPALTEPKTVDTLAIARRRFYLNSNRLDYIAKLLFGEGKNDAPFKLWKKILLENDPEALRLMKEYCQRDVRLLERVYHEFTRFHAPKSHAGVMNGMEKWTCAHCASSEVRRKKRRVTARGTIQHSMVCKDCRRHYTVSNRDYEKYLEYKNSRVPD